MARGRSKLVVSGWVIVALASAAPAQEPRSATDSLRVTELHQLANKMLPVSSVSRSPEVRRLDQALDALRGALERASESPTSAPLQPLAAHRRQAEQALTKLVERMRERKEGKGQAEEVLSSFSPLWRDIDDALAADGSPREQRLIAARDRVDAARASGGAEVSGISIVSDSTGNP